MKPLQELSQFEYSERDRISFAKGTLWKRWLREYPQLFDKKDEMIFKRQAKMKNARYKFFECQAAVLLYENYGYWSLLEKYATKSDHPCKKRIAILLNSPELYKAIEYLKVEYQGHGPDLLVYSPDLAEWFFAEVKSPTDSLSSDQELKFAELSNIIGKPVRLITFFKSS